MSNLSSINFSMIYKSRQVLSNLLKQRGYNVGDYENHSINDVHLLEKTGNLDMVVSKSNGKKLYVKFFTDKSLRDTHIYTLMDELFEIRKVISKTDDIIIVNKTPPNDTIRKTLNTLYFNDDIFVSVICIKNLQFNILDHSLVPKHEILEKEEDIKKLYKRFNVNSNNEFPQISRFDPVALAVGLKPNDICKITRKSTASIESEYYRICVPN